MPRAALPGQNEAGIFVVCDVRRFLEGASWDAEHALWRRILDSANVDITS